jgi:DNA-directed RNA polymerase specialized sigma24 family protein
VNYVETVLADTNTEVALSRLDFPSCYARELSSLIWFVMSLGADAHRAADVAQSTFAEAFSIWDRIQHPNAWLRRVAARIYYRTMVPQETPVDVLPDRQGPLSTVTEVELHDEARAVLAALADLPPKQRPIPGSASSRAWFPGDTVRDRLRCIFFCVLYFRRSAA